MPLYDYICDKCGEVAEKIVSYDTPNPICCGEVMRRKFPLYGFWRWANDPNGSSPAIRRHAEKIEKKYRG